MNNENVSILICDDSILARKNLSSILSALGFSNINEVSNGQAAVDYVKEQAPDIVFLDIIMPVKDGITATKEIKEINPATTVVICSSVGTQSHLREAIKAGAKDFIQKPVEGAMVKQVIDHITR
ncbi:MAG: response regulator [Lachnospiraceae bacterium]|nr:response regulator [Lachnospiraceae bacterium]